MSIAMRWTISPPAISRAWSNFPTPSNAAAGITSWPRPGPQTWAVRASVCPQPGPHTCASIIRSTAALPAPACSAHMTDARPSTPERASEANETGPDGIGPPNCGVATAAGASGAMSAVVSRCRSISPPRRNRRPGAYAHGARTQGLNAQAIRPAGTSDAYE